MSTAGSHIIHKLNLHIEVPDERLARRAYDKAGTWLQEYVLPQLEDLLRRLDLPDIHIRLDKLDVALHVDNTSSMEAALREQLAAAIVKQVRTAIDMGVDNDKASGREAHIQVDAKGHIMEALLWFLEYGQLPWWVVDRAALSTSHSLIEAIAAVEDKFVRAFVSRAKRKPVILRRLVQQYDRELLTYIFSLIVPLDIFTLVMHYEAQLLEWAGSMPDTVMVQLGFWQKVWSMPAIQAWRSPEQEDTATQLKRIVSSISEGYQSMPSIGDILQQQEWTSVEHASQQYITSETSEDLWTESNDPESRKDSPEIGIEVLADHAGLLLLHPFLQYFFMESGLLDGDYFKDDEARATAVHLLHYLATGQEQVPDFNLLFEKYLCGMEPARITSRYITLTAKMKTEAEDMLTAVLKHWTVLKSTSMDGLREGFLQRKGKWISNEDSYRIIVERNTLDILLQQIPWNISLIKLPWLKYIIHVDWAA